MNKFLSINTRWPFIAGQNLTDDVYCVSCVLANLCYVRCSVYTRNLGKKKGLAMNFPSLEWIKIAGIELIDHLNVSSAKSTRLKRL